VNVWIGSERARMAELLGVDEIVGMGSAGPTVGFALRVGPLWEKVVIDEPFVMTAASKVALELITRKLFDAARALKVRAEQARRRGALREFIATVDIVPRLDYGFSIVADPSVPPDSFELRSGSQRVVVKNVGGGRVPTNRFEAVAEELKNT
jgi:hypothetical protein